MCKPITLDSINSNNHHKSICSTRLRFVFFSFTPQIFVSLSLALINSFSVIQNKPQSISKISIYATSFSLRRRSFLIVKILMEFESEDAAKMFYDDYSRSLGFVMRVMSCRRSERDGRILARRFGCNKEGRCVSVRGKSGSVRKPRQSTRGGLVRLCDSC
ncbi:hypothetical protein BRARA_D02623 [Brassica rapa]|uniref:FAR1 domain-containing protein n=1 Tax=Brassica campestris TaxID=3711 RepID=A0A397ZRB5_BRACM|nr:hypothetical protein BRARA_D02623 [Brassica rapa]